jgi:hypothetical protein
VLPCVILVFPSLSIFFPPEHKCESGFNIPPERFYWTTSGGVLKPQGQTLNPKNSDLSWLFFLTQVI